MITLVTTKHEGYEGHEEGFVQELFVIFDLFVSSWLSVVETDD